MKGFHFYLLRCKDILTKVSQSLLQETYTGVQFNEKDEL